VCFRDRSESGAVEVALAFALPVRDIAELLHMPRSTVSDAISLLVTKKLLLVEQPSAGRRPTTYRLPRRWNSFSKTGPD
jgi:DNA-binding MarR family transcriptional regulator